MFAEPDINTRGVWRKTFSIAFIKLINFPERKRKITSREFLYTNSSTRNKFLFCKKMNFKKRIHLKCQLKRKKLTHVFVKILQVSPNMRMGKWSKLVEFSTKKPFQMRACVISTRKAKYLDVTNMFTYSRANTPLGQSERAFYVT